MFLSRSSLFPATLLLAALLPVAAAPVVNFNDTWHYRKGTSAPEADWKTLDDAALDASWLSGPGWIGYGDGTGATAAGTTLGDMRQVSGGSAGYRVFYMRKTFTVDNTLPGTDDVFLTVDFDDGFIAWLDGTFIDSAGSPGSPAEPAYNYTGTTASHECSFGDGTQSAVRSTNIGKVAVKLAPGTHTLAVMCLNQNLTSSDAVLKVGLATQAPPPPVDFHWELSESPIVLSAVFNVPAGQTLTIDPGVEVRCHGGADAIDSLGTINAVGTEAQPIRFVRSAAGTAWQRIATRGSGVSTFKYCDFDGSGTSGTIRGGGTSTANPTVVLENCRFLNTQVQMVDLTWSSCRIVNCEFDSIGAQELLHFSNMPPSGHALVKGCRFGLPGTPPTSGYNDIIDFTGGNRPGPIAEFVGNLFLASVDDCFDMDGTDAHIEGNIFLNVRKDASRSSSSNPITTGSNGSDRSELVICRNYFYNCEHAFMEKDYGTALMQNNTVVRLTSNSFSANTDPDGNEGSGIIMFGEPWRGFPFGDGVVFDGNIASEIDPAITDPWPVLAGASSEAGFFFPRRHNCIQRFLQPGTGNLDADPMFVSTTGLDHTNVLQKLALQPGSPCVGTGPNGIDMGAAVPAGASVSGAPTGTTASRDATLVVAGPGIWAYRWKLDGGAWSNEVSLVPASIWNGQPFTGTMLDASPAISLTNLADGPHTVEVQGRNSAGSWQADSVTRTWTVMNTPADTDLDGLPDAWEAAHGLNPNSNADATLDGDGDGLSNRDEFIAGTAPNDRTSALVLRTTNVTGNGNNITFPVVAGKTYRLEVSHDLTAGSWTTLQVFPAAAADGTANFPDPEVPVRQKRFYRVTTPAE